MTKSGKLIWVATMVLALAINRPVQAGLQFTSISLNTILHFGSGLIGEFANFGGNDTPTNINNNGNRLTILGVSFKNLGQTMDDMQKGSTSLAQALTENTDEAQVEGPALVFPNPFRQAKGAKLGYRLNKDMDLEIHIYDMLANRILDETFRSGNDGGKVGYNKIVLDTTSWNGTILSAGVYFYVLINNGKVLAKGKMAVIP